MDELHQGCHGIRLDVCIAEAIDDNPLLGLSNLMLGDALPGVAHPSSGLDHAEYGDELIVFVFPDGMVMWSRREGVVEHDDRLVVFSLMMMLSLLATGLLTDGAP